MIDRVSSMLTTRRAMASVRAVLTTALLLTVTGCASLPDDPAERAEVEALNDPFEPLNRQIYDFNRNFRAAVVEPIAAVYNAPEFEPVRVPLQNVLQNLRSPSIFVNDLAQGRPCAATVTFIRFVFNSTAGLAGILDVAEVDRGLAAHENSVAQTLAVWGMPEGPHLMLPVLGPSNVRGAVGLGAEFAFDLTDMGLAQLGLSVLTWPRFGAEFFDEKASVAPDLAKLERSSLDGYAALRSAFRQSEVEDRREPSCPVVLHAPRRGEELLEVAPR